MASLSLPRVLHPRKTSLEIERENFEKAQNTAIHKAINNHEVPVKQKHVRSTIIGTFQEQGAQTFWAVALRLPFMDDRIVAWKLCHVVHKVLREGHPLCLVHSQRHKGDLDDMGKLWCHLREGYGKMIRLYANLLMTKLDFHMRNPRFPGHLGVTNDELESIGSNDINNYFQLSVEMFDYMDNILELQEAIFASTDRSRPNSMTSAGQCRLAPLIMCIQDASRLYDYCVKILFKLHSTLPADLLVGHRDRFLQQFQGLKKFYQSTNALQYFRNLISIPPLPERPPDFRFASESRTYVTQEVVVPPEEDEIEEANLIDTSDTSSQFDHVDNGHVETPQNSASPAGRPVYPPMEMLAERDDLIKHLQSELEKMRNENVLLQREKLEGLRHLHEQITLLQTDLATKESELVHERQIKDDLFHQASTEAQSKDSEQKLKEEKFNKLKQIYQKLRTEHIDLLRLKAEVDKKCQMSSNRQEESQQKVVDLETKIRELQHESTKLTELRQTSQQQDEELLSLRRDKDLFNMEREILKKNLEDAIREKAQLKDEIEIEKLDKEQSRLKMTEINSRIEELEDESRRYRELQKTSGQQNAELDQLKNDRELLNTKINDLQSSIDVITSEKSQLGKQLEDIKTEAQQLTDKLTEALNELEKTKSDNLVSVLLILTKSVEEAEATLKRSIDELENPALSAVRCSPDYFRSLTRECKQAIEATINVNHNEPVHAIIVAHRLAHTVSSYLLLGRATSNTSPDITFGERMADACKKLGGGVLSVLEAVRLDKPAQGCVTSAVELLVAVDSLAETISGSLRGETAEKLANMIDDELSAMDKAIEEAALKIQEMLSNSRAAHTGIKLKVNEKILDSCTSLMQAIKILVQKARLLQEEIVVQGKGTASAKEFYKRNHRWTDGFISAAKAVAVAAKFFLNAADKVVSGQGKLEQLVVGSQEIAASTAQLVVASRVKAERKSNNLQQLGIASKGVTNATAGVVATVKDCGQLMEEAEEIDTSNMTLHQAKRLEMDSQVRVLELEKDLQLERLRLSALRRHHYQLAGEGEGWEVVNNVNE